MAIGGAVLGRKVLTKETELRVVNAMVIPTLIYGCEAWALQARHKGRIQATQMRVLRGGIKVRENEEYGS